MILWFKTLIDKFVLIFSLCLSFPFSRFQRQLSEPLLPFPPPDGAACTPYPPQPHHPHRAPLSRDGRPIYQRHLSEPLVLLPAQGFKQELVDLRYTEQGVPTMGPPRTPFQGLSIKQEPRDFCFDQGEPWGIAGWQRSLRLSFPLID